MADRFIMMRFQKTGLFVSVMAGGSESANSRGFLLSEFQ
jgi:hypothetical protein